jgi:hypothetical protein
VSLEDSSRRQGASLWLSVAAVVLLQALLVWPSLSCLLDSLQDEGAVAGAASRVLHGQVPFRDFVSRMMPGTYYTVAAWLWCFGETIGALRGYFFFTACLLAGLVQLISCRILPARWSELPALLFLATGVQFFPFASFHWDTTIAALLAIAILWGSLPRGPWREVLAGVACGLSVLFLQTKGLATCVGCGLSLLLLRRPALPALGRLIAGAALVGVPFVLGLLASQAWSPFWAQTLGITRGNYAVFQRAPFSTAVVWSQLGSMLNGTGQLAFPPTAAQLWWLLAGWSFALVDVVKYAGYYPVLLFGLLYVAQRWSKDRDRLSVSEAHLLTLTLVLSLASLFDLVRANRYRLVLQMPLWSVLLAVLLLWLYRRYARLATVLTATVALIFSLHALDNALGWSHYRYPVRSPRGLLWASHPGIANRANAALRTMETVPPGQPVLGFPDVPLFLWLSGRPNPTHLDELFPVLTPRPELEAAIETVARSQPPLILFFPLDPRLGGDYPALPPELMAREQEWLRRSLTEGYSEFEGPGFLFYRPAGAPPSGMGQVAPKR